MASSSEILFSYVCPLMGSIMANAMFAAPVLDLRQALIDGKLGCLNPFPWAWGLTNCLGWTIYGFLRSDPFVVASNLPGFVLHIWLNSGAARLQYLEIVEMKKVRHDRTREWDASSPDENDESTLLTSAERMSQENAFVMAPQETAVLSLLFTWSLVLVYCAWFTTIDPAAIVGYVVNVNLIVFFGAPLQSMRTVLETSNAESIHGPTMVMNWLNTSFWIAYGTAKMDPIIILPNAIGLMLGLAQGVLKAFYPSHTSNPLPCEDDS